MQVKRTTEIELTSNEVAEIIKKHLKEQGYKVTDMKFNLVYDDDDSYSKQIFGGATAFVVEELYDNHIDME